MQREIELLSASRAVAIQQGGCVKNNKKSSRKETIRCEEKTITATRSSSKVVARRPRWILARRRAVSVPHAELLGKISEESPDGVVDGKLIILLAIRLGVEIPDLRTHLGSRKLRRHLKRIDQGAGRRPVYVLRTPQFRGLKARASHKKK